MLCFYCLGEEVTGKECPRTVTSSLASVVMEPGTVTGTTTGLAVTVWAVMTGATSTASVAAGADMMIGIVITATLIHRGDAETITIMAAGCGINMNLSG